MNLKLATIYPERIGKAFIQVYFCIVLIIFFGVAYNIVRFPYGVDYGEAPLMDQVKKLQVGESIYKNDFNSPPYIVANYPPLYPLLVAGITDVFNSMHFQTGRIVAFFFSIISGIIVGLFASSITNKKILGLVAGAIYLGNPYVIVWSSQARVDMMALAFTLIGLYILYRHQDSTGWLFLAILCFLISIFTRQTYLLAGPLAGFIWVFRKNRRRSILFLCVLAFSSLLTFGMINALTQGGFYMNIVTANVNEYLLSRTMTMFRQLFVIWPVFLVTVGILLILVFRGLFTSRNGSPAKIATNEFSSYGLSVFTIGALLTALTVGKVGSDVNYFLELIAATSIWIAIAIALLTSTQNKLRGLFLGLFLVQLIWIIISIFPITGPAIGTRSELMSQYDSLYQQISIAAGKGIVLSDDYMDMVVLSDQSIYYQPFEYGQLYRAGLWNPSGLVEDIEQKIFPLVVIGGETVYKECCWPEPIATALVANYDINQQSGLLLLTPDNGD